MSQSNGQSQTIFLRWNNHQSNLLAVFNQLLTSKALVDVTLAVEGQKLHAHKMVLSACSPYFQTLLFGHPDIHPTVILKDVPLVDMRSLLDFMYRGEVNVDQNRLSAFLKVAESLRIKGLTEVNEVPGDLPWLAFSLLQSHSSSLSSSPVHNNGMAHEPQLQRIHNYSPLLMKRPITSHPHHDQQRQFLSYPMNSLLGSAMSAPNRKLKLSRKLFTGCIDYEGSGPYPPDFLELNMSEESKSAAPRHLDSPSQNDHDDIGEEYTENGMEIKQEPIDTITGKFQVTLRSVLAADQKSKFSLAVSQYISGYRQQLQTAIQEEKLQMQESLQRLHYHQQQQQQQQQAAAASLRTPVKWDSSSSDPPEQLTGMSVRGLNLTRYATVSKGIYKCLKCTKINKLMTFKKKYSFQRHAFLYHEGHRRKVFPCPMCAKEFSRPDKTQHHMKTVHITTVSS